MKALIITILLFIISSCAIGINKDLESSDEGIDEVVVEEIEEVKTKNDIKESKLFNENKKAPDLIGLKNWINGEEIKSLDELKGKVVMIDFWTYTCINCIRTFKHVESLHKKYEKEGLVIIAIHAPEFSYEKKLENVIKAVKKYNLTYRVVQDNDFKTWRNYKNHYWPAQYIIDKDGILRFHHYGEGAYEEIEEVIQLLLR